MRSLRIGLGAAAYCAGIGITYEFSQPKPSLPTAAQRCCTFENLAPEYDTEVEHDETAAGILAMRAELAASARGKVLEIAAGTGRNLPFYKREQVEALVISDYSEQMLTVAARKVAQLRDIEKHAMPSAITLAVMDAAALPFADSTYDTIVDSFGLCSFEEPQSVLREMGGVARWVATCSSWSMARAGSRRYDGGSGIALIAMCAVMDAIGIETFRGLSGRVN
eukprot:CAMPEP_0119323306 /NCGR_PEP_ID=MMETSP1333-20130426/60428_1 /TAXON_ID=418940 /ORGANISM="Scyphosphaera apsteinii, Strain RCC1455" /LENGTH=222 /DNA_ID=CAMNT_0007330713 /DNA_START=20 /DNA_END=689 /DNA_ORIENTATION=-